MSSLATHLLCPVTLAKGNTIGQQFFSLVSSDYPNYLSFIADLQRNPEKVYDKLNPADKDGLMGNLQLILEAEKHEEYMLAKFHSMIFQIVNKVRFDRMDMDEAYVEGQKALRKALWNYNDPCIKFSTIFYTYIQSALRDYRKSILGKRSSNKEKTNYFDPANKKLYSSITAKSSVTDVEYEKSENMSVQDLMHLNCVDEFDKVVVNFYLEFKSQDVNWVDLVIAEHIKMYNDSITANAVRNRLNRITDRAKNYVIENDISASDVNK